MKIELAPGLDKFVAEKIRTGEYLDAGEVVRDSLRRWREQEQLLLAASERLEQEIQEGFDSTDLPVGKDFWPRLRKELHSESKNGRRR